MGNNNSTENIKVDNGQQNEIFKYFVRPDATFNQTQRIPPSMQETYAKAEKLYQNKISKYNDPYNDEKLIKYNMDQFTDPIRGISMPYYSDTIPSKARYESLVSSDNPRYIELVVCNYPMEDIKEKFAVHHIAPNHECKANCHCIESLISINDKNNDKNNEYSLFSQTSPKNNKLSHMLSATSSELINQDMILSVTSPEPYNLVQAGGGCPTCRRPLKNHMKGGTCAGLRNNQMVGGTCAGLRNNQMVGGDDDNETTLDSEEYTDEAFSETSDMNNDTINLNDKKQKKKKKEEDDDKDEDDEDKEDMYDEEIDEDEEDEILEGIDDEEITEDGFILEESDISSSDLYRMQSRIFHSNTEIEKDDDDETTEKVRRAMAQVNRRSMFDSEEKEILNLQTSSENYMSRPARRNNKYY